MTRGFQWFVAWRYLMTRPRHASATIFGVAALLLLGAAVCAAVGLWVLQAPDPAAFPARGSPYRENVLLAAVGLAAFGELAIILGICRYYFTFFTTVSVAGVAIGSMALVIVLSVMSGFESDLREKILGSNAHILISKDEGKFTEYRAIQDKLEGVPGVVATMPYLTSEVVITGSNNYQNVIIKGIEPQTVGKVTELEKDVEQERALERLWPLDEDGNIVGPPEPENGLGAGAPEEDGEDGDDADPVDGEIDFEIRPPVDFSGGVTPPPAPPDDEDDGDEADADLDFEIRPPVDFSGGEVPPEPRALDADAGAAIDGDAGARAGKRGEIRVQLGDRSPPEVWDDEGEVRRAPRIPPRVATLPGVLVGRELVKQNHHYVGQEVKIISPLADERAPEPAPRVRFLRVAGTFYTGMYEYDLKFVYIDLEVLQTFLDLDGEATGIEVRVRNPERTAPILREIEARLGPEYRVQDWKEINRNLFSALKLEKIAMFLVLAIIILVASFSIIGNLIMVVVEKAKEIALLKTLGASNGGVMRIFVIQGLFIGLVGTGVGVIHGLIACLLAKRFGLPLDPDVYYIDRLPIHIESTAIMAVAAAGIIISVLATLYPAYVAARLRPVEGLRYE